MPTYNDTPSQSRLGGSDDVPDALVRVNGCTSHGARAWMCAEDHRLVPERDVTPSFGLV